MLSEKIFDIGISYAIEDINIVNKVINELKKLNISVFIDNEHESFLVGRNLAYSLKTALVNRCKYCLIFISESYVSKKWTRYESELLLQKRIELLQKDFLTDNIIPVRLDETELEGWNLEIIGFDISKQNPERIAAVMWEKLNNQPFIIKEKYLSLEMLYTELIDEVEESLKNLTAFSYKLKRNDSFESTIQLQKNNSFYFIHILLDKKILKIYDGNYEFCRLPNAWDAEIYLQKDELFYINYNFSIDMPCIPILFTKHKLLELFIQKLNEFVKEHEYV